MTRNLSKLISGFYAAPVSTSLPHGGLFRAASFSHLPNLALIQPWSPRSGLVSQTRCQQGKSELLNLRPDCVTPLFTTV